MLSSKFFYTLVALVVAVFAICNLSFGQSVSEPFWGGIQRTWKVNPIIKQKNSCQFKAAGGNLLSGLGNDRFVKNPKFQSMLSPRFYPSDMGAQVRYNMADYENQAVPCKPLTFGNMAEENYENPVVENYPSASASCSNGSCGGGCSPSCGKGGMPIPYHGGDKMMPAGFAAGNYNQVADKVYSQSDYPEISDVLPVGTMTTMDAEGNVTEPVVYQQFMFANPKSRLRSLGDPIRGDLPIVPCEGNWFSVHPTVNIDLQQGAMNVIGGVQNETSTALAQLIHDSSGQTAIGGVDLSEVNMTPQYSTGFNSIMSDVTVSGYP